MDELQPIPRNWLSPEPLRTMGVSDTSIEVPRPGLKRDYAGLLEYWQMVRRHKGAVVLVTFLGGLLGFLITLASPRVYQAKATLEFQGLNEEFLNVKNVSPVSDNYRNTSDTDIQTQVKVLQSRSLIGSVERKNSEGKSENRK